MPHTCSAAEGQQQGSHGRYSSSWWWVTCPEKRGSQLNVGLCYRAKKYFTVCVLLNLLIFYRSVFPPCHGRTYSHQYKICVPHSCWSSQEFFSLVMSLILGILSQPMLPRHPHLPSSNLNSLLSSTTPFTPYKTSSPLTQSTAPTILQAFLIRFCCPWPLSLNFSRVWEGI